MGTQHNLCIRNHWRAPDTLCGLFDKLDQGHRCASGSNHLPGDPVHLGIPAAVEIVPFDSVRSLASIIKRPLTTGWHYLQGMRFVAKHLSLVPDQLSANQKSERVHLSTSLKPMLESAKHRDVHIF
jgi:hypothetical protein